MKKENLIWYVFLGIGAIFLIASIIVCQRVFDYSNTIDTKAIITEIDYDVHNDNHKVYVEYTIDGKKYNEKLGSYSSSFYEGKEIDIYVNKDNYHKIGNKDLDLLVLIFPGVGVIFFIIGGIGVLVNKKNKSNSKKLKEYGNIIYANFKEVKLNAMFSVNGRNPYNIICEWTDPETNSLCTFKSENIWDDPTGIILERKIITFKVYIDSNNKKKYYMDVDDIKNENLY